MRRGRNGEKIGERIVYQARSLGELGTDIDFLPGLLDGSRIIVSPITTMMSVRGQESVDTLAICEVTWREASTPCGAATMAGERCSGEHLVFVFVRTCVDIL